MNLHRVKPAGTASLITTTYLLLSLLYLYLSNFPLSPFYPNNGEFNPLYKIHILVLLLFSSGIIFFVSFFGIRKLSRAFQLLTRIRKLKLPLQPVSKSLLAASLTHDFNNLLSIVQMNMERLELRNDLSEGARYALERLQSSIQRLSELVTRFKNEFTTSVQSENTKFSLQEIIRDSVDLIKEHPKVLGCKIEVEYHSSEDIELEGMPILILQIITNLILNAAEATNSNGQILLSIESSEEFVSIAVHDNGIGIPFDLRKSIFDAFHTTKKDGMGLGLLSVQFSLDEFNGRIHISDSKLGGACFRLELPRIQ